MLDLHRVQSKSKSCLELSVPVPPSVNHMYYNTRGGGKRLTKLAETYLQRVRAYAKQCIEEQGWAVPEKGVWLKMELVFYFPDKRIRDSHNCLKILLDALEGACFINDYYIVPRILTVELDKENPRTLVRFTHITDKDRQKSLQGFANMVN